MNNIIYLIAGVAVGAGCVVVLRWAMGRKKKIGLIERQRIEKEADKERIYGLLETNTPLTNSHIHMMLDIPESTATRYLDELEKEGRVRQVGQTGAHVYYERVN